MKILLYLGLLLFLSACSSLQTQTKIQQITVKDVEYISIPDSYLQPCVLPKPPDKSIYLHSSLSQREELLTKLYLHALSVHRSCNIRLENALKYQKAMLERYDKRDTKTHP